VDQKLGDIGDLAGALSGGQASQFDDSVTEELESVCRRAGVQHRQQPKETKVQGDADAVVERKSDVTQLFIDVLDFARCGDHPQGPSGGVEGTVAKELFECQPASTTNGLEAVLKYVHELEGSLLGHATRLAYLFEDDGEV